MIVWQSLTNVNRIDGSIGIVTIGFGHDDDHDLNPIGTIKRQGELIGHTGTYGASGDHCHMEVVNGTYDGFELVPDTAYYRMKNSTHIYDMLGINDTIIYRSLGYDWRSFSNNYPSPPTPYQIKKGSFPWVLYANKLRNKRVQKTY